MKNRIVLIVTIIIVLFPFLYNLYLGFLFPNGVLLESSIFSVDYATFINQMVTEKSVLFAGNNTPSLLSYFPIYFLFFLGEIVIKNKVIVYFSIIIWLLIWSIISFFSCMKSYTSDQGNEFKMSPWIISLLCILFYSCLSNFLFFQASIFFFLPIVIFIIQLKYILLYLEKRKKYILLFPLILSFLIIQNLTLFVLDIIFMNLFLNLYSSRFKNKKIDLLYINISFLPALFLATISVLLSNLYLGGDSKETLNIINEDFYSINYNIYTTLTQTGFWGLFGGFNGELYYQFSSFYSQKISHLFAYLPYVLILWLYINSSPKRSPKNNKNILLLLIYICVIIAFMQGLHNPLYAFLYNNFSPFQIFRNITKVAPFLQLCIVFLLFILIYVNQERSTKKFQRWIIIVLSLSIIYNIPYWTYSNNFFGKRMIPEIPIEYIESAKYINTNSTKDDKILLLPMVYNLEVYNWKGRNYNVQGNLYDALIENQIRHIRFGELLTGPNILQKEFKNILIKDRYSPRKFDIDYKKFDSFLKNKHFNKILVTNNILSEYQDISELNTYLKRYNYSLVFENNKTHIFEKDSYKVPLFSSSGDTIVKYKRHNAKHYTVSLTNLSVDSPLIFNEYYDKDWTIFVKKNHSLYEREIYFLFKPSPLDETHILHENLYNSWDISSTKIKNFYSPEYYSENSNESINIDIDIYFKPQAILILLLWIELFIFLFISLIFLIPSRLKHNRHT